MSDTERQVVDHFDVGDLFGSGLDRGAGHLIVDDGGPGELNVVGVERMAVVPLEPRTQAHGVDEMIFRFLEALDHGIVDEPLELFIEGE